MGTAKTEPTNTSLNGNAADSAQAQEAQLAQELAQRQVSEPMNNMLYPMSLPFRMMQQWTQSMIDWSEFVYYASVARYHKPEWATENEIVNELNCFKMRKFSKKDSSAIPTLILPPFAGHYSTITDYAEDQSLVQHLMDYGLENVYSLDYNSATEEMKYYDIDNYLMELDIMIDDLGGKANLIGLCQGGWYASIFAARFPNKVQTLTVAGAPIDTQAGDGYLQNIVANAPDTFFDNLVNMGQGIMDGKLLLQGFKNMNPFDHYWQKYIDLYKYVQGPHNDKEALERFMAFEIWYENTLKLPGRWYRQVIEELFKNNNFLKGKFKALGKLVKPEAITCPVYLLGGERDDITLPVQVLEAANHIGTPKDKIGQGIAKAGHIGLFMSRSVLKSNWKDIAEWLLKNQN